MRYANPPPQEIAEPLVQAFGKRAPYVFDEVMKAWYPKVGYDGLYARRLDRLRKALGAFYEMAFFTPSMRRKQKSPYLKLVIDWFKHGSIDRNSPWEDIETTLPVLEKFHELVQAGRIKGAAQKPTIENYPTPGAMTKRIRDALGVEGGDTLDCLGDGAHLVYQDWLVKDHSKIRVYQIETYPAMKRCGSGTSWCVVPNEGYFQSYGPPFFMMTVLDPEEERQVLLMHPSEFQAKDVDDDSLVQHRRQGRSGAPYFQLGKSPDGQQFFVPSAYVLDTLFSGTDIVNHPDLMVELYGRHVLPALNRVFGKDAVSAGLGDLGNIDLEALSEAAENAASLIAELADAAKALAETYSMGEPYINASEDAYLVAQAEWNERYEDEIAEGTKIPFADALDEGDDEAEELEMEVRDTTLEEYWDNDAEAQGLKEVGLDSIDEAYSVNPKFLWQTVFGVSADVFNKAWSNDNWEKLLGFMHHAQGVIGDIRSIGDVYDYAQGLEAIWK